MWFGPNRSFRQRLQTTLIALIFVVALRRNGETIQAADLPPEILASSAPLSVAAPDKAQILHALGQADGNRSETARILGVSRATFYRRLRESGLPAGDL